MAPTPEAPKGPTDAAQTRYETAEGMPAPPDPFPTVSQEQPAGPPRLDPGGAEQASTIPDRRHPGPGQLPRLFGKYQLVREIAHGGMGIVYEAWELASDAPSLGEPRRVRKVALKQILPQRLDVPEALERFLLEIATAKKLDHRNIVPIYESGEVDRQHYFTMPFVEKGSLQPLVEGVTRLTPRQAAGLVLRIAEAVQSAHGFQDESGRKKPIIHRDIKPHNILLKEETASLSEADDESSALPFVPQLTDFGLAKVLTDTSGLTLTQKGEAMGTPGYMPPEQARGDVDGIGTHSDVYGLGAVLYALLAGRAPFPRKPPAPFVEVVLDEVKGAEPIPPRRLNAAVPGDLEAICLKCLEKEPARRYAGAEQLIQDLDAFLHDRPLVHARRASWPLRAGRRLLKSVRRHPVRTLYFALSLAAFVALAWLVWSPGRGLGPETGPLLEDARHETGRARAAWNGAPPDRLAALDHYAIALQKYEELVARAPAGPGALELRLERARVSLERAAILARDPNQREAARAAFEATLKALVELQVAGEAPEQEAGRDPRRLRLLGEAYHNLGSLCNDEQTPARQAEALRFYNRALPIRTLLCDAAPNDLDDLRELARNYGYMGDTQLELGMTRAAEASYAAAAERRKDVVDRIQPGRVKERVDALCSQARDLGNKAYLAELTGDNPAALRRHLDRDAFYHKHLADRPLPGEFRTERIETQLLIVDLLLDLEGATPAACDYLTRAAAEHDRLLGDKGKPEDDRELRSTAARIELLSGKALVLAGLTEEAGRHLRKAKGLYEGLTARDNTPTPDDWYRRAVAEALLAQMSEGDVREDGNRDAVEHLKQAVAAGLKNPHRLKRDRAFQQFAGPEKRRFDTLLKDLEKKRQRAADAEAPR